MQQIAMRLYTGFRQRKYLMWSALAFLRMDDRQYQEHRRTLLPLVGGLLRKELEAAADPLGITPDEFWVALRLRQREGDYAGALEWLVSNAALTTKREPVMYCRLLASTLELAGKPREAAAVAWRILRGSSNDAPAEESKAADVAAAITPRQVLDCPFFDGFGGGGAAGDVKESGPSVPPQPLPDSRYLGQILLHLEAQPDDWEFLCTFIRNALEVVASLPTESSGASVQAPDAQQPALEALLESLFRLQESASADHP